MLRLFEEEQTDFGASSVGLLVRRQLYVHNPTNSNIVCSAITSSNPVNFHAGFLENKVFGGLEICKKMPKTGK
jgi:hypothetical protein